TVPGRPFTSRLWRHPAEFRKIACARSRCSRRAGRGLLFLLTEKRRGRHPVRPPASGMRPILLAEVEAPLSTLTASKLTIRLLYGIGALLAIVVAAAFVVPHVVDWNRYRNDIALELSAATGRNIKILGDIELSVLPVPTLSARDVRIANVPGGTADDFARIGAYAIRLSLAPLLTGRIEAQSVS